jgi:hypothetical protein
MKKEARGKEPHPYRCGEIFEVAYRAWSAIRKKVAHDTRHWAIASLGYFPSQSLSLSLT